MLDRGADDEALQSASNVASFDDTARGGETNSIDRHGLTKGSEQLVDPKVEDVSHLCGKCAA
jgi:hypothetical protein